MILTPLQKLPKNVGDLGKFIVAKCFEWLPKVQKLPNLVTLVLENVLKAADANFNFYLLHILTVNGLCWAHP